MASSSPVKVRIVTPVGPLAVVGTQQGVTDIYFEPRQPGRSLSASSPSAEGLTSPVIPTPVRRAVEQLEQYFHGRRVPFDFKMQYAGTPFQEKVWAYLLTIPIGETRTYSQVAAAVGQPRGARAVGGAVGRNPISIAIPCHRVVGKNGKGGGYGGGMAAKRWLLQHESALQSTNGSGDQSTQEGTSG